MSRPSGPGRLLAFLSLVTDQQDVAKQRDEKVEEAGRLRWVDWETRQVIGLPASAVSGSPFAFYQSGFRPVSQQK